LGCDGARSYYGKSANSSAEAGENFARHMRAFSNFEEPQMVHGFDWTRFRRIVDVGGSRGRFLQVLLER
jgi:hypothetical protein